MSWIVKGCALAFKIIVEVKISSPLNYDCNSKPIVKIVLKDYKYIVGEHKHLDL